MKPSSADSQVILGLASEMSALVLQELVGNELSTSINGSELTRKTLYTMSQNSIQRHFAKELGVN